MRFKKKQPGRRNWRKKVMGEGRTVEVEKEKMDEPQLLHDSEGGTESGGEEGELKDSMHSLWLEDVA